MNDSAYFDRSTSFMDLSAGKYLKSSLTETDKKKILDNINRYVEVTNLESKVKTHRRV